MEKAAGTTDGFLIVEHRATDAIGFGLALARFEAAVGFVDHINATTAANHAVVTVASFEGLQGIDDFHRICP
jgi:hypothetical protein